ATLSGETRSCIPRRQRSDRAPKGASAGRCFVRPVAGVLGSGVGFDASLTSGPAVDVEARQREVLDAVVKYRKEAVSALGREPIPVYLFLTQRFNSTGDIRSDYLFQFVFRSYYRLDNAGLGDELKVAYFELLQGHRFGPRPDLRQLCEQLARYDTKKGK